MVCIRPSIPPVGAALGRLPRLTAPSPSPPADYSAAGSYRAAERPPAPARSEEHTSELQSQFHLVCRLLLEKKKRKSAMWPRPGMSFSILVPPTRGHGHPARRRCVLLFYNSRTRRTRLRSITA